MRTRSPRIAPPLNGLVGSTASTPTSPPVARSRPTSWSVSVDFPAPGAPVMPIDHAFPVRGCRISMTARASAPPRSTSEMTLAIERRSPSSARSTSAAVASPMEGGRYSLLVGDDLGDAGDAIHDDALDAGLQRHHRDGAGAAGADQRDVHDAVGVDAVEDDVAAVALQRGTDRVDGL